MVIVEKIFVLRLTFATYSRAFYAPADEEQQGEQDKNHRKHNRSRQGDFRDHAFIRVLRDDDEA